VGHPPLLTVDPYAYELTVQADRPAELRANCGSKDLKLFLLAQFVKKINSVATGV
jgi:hypothetical protein